MPAPSLLTTHLSPYLAICRTLNGLWQVSGGHGSIDPRQAITDMLAYYDAGLTTWDLADHYGPAEDFIGQFRQRLRQERGEAALRQVQALTKWVPQPGRMSRDAVRRAIDISRRRMGVDTLDLLQFHWWDYQNDQYLVALDHLAELRREGIIRELGLTNFDTVRVREIIARGIPVVSNQVQYSLVDQRPQRQMAHVCAQHGIALLTYGTLAGGMLTDRYLGQPEPGRQQLTTVSLRKYKQMIDLWGGWSLFQHLLQALRQVADRHQTTIAQVAVRAIMDRPAVGGVIVGARLSIAGHIAETQALHTLALTEDDRRAIAVVTDQGRDLLQVIGDCGEEYR